MKITRRLAILVGACALATGLAAPAVSAAEPPPDRPIARLVCRAQLLEAAPVASCEWRVLATGATSVELWRGTGVDGQQERVKVYTGTDLTVQRFTDTTVEKGKRYGYLLLVFGAEGRQARSNPAVVSFRPEREVERLALDCRRTESKTVSCEWRSPASPTAVSVTLFVTVNGGAPTPLVTLSPAAGGSFEYPVVEGTRVLRFALVSLDSDGEVDGRSAVLPFVFVRPRR